MPAHKPQDARRTDPQGKNEEPDSENRSLSTEY